MFSMRVFSNEEARGSKLNYALTKEQIESFKTNGFLVLPPQFSSDEIQNLIKLSDEVIDKSGPLTHDNPRLQLEPDHIDGRPIVRKVEPLTEFVPEFQDLIDDERICGPLESLFGEAPAIFEQKINFKFAKVGTPYILHQDYSYWKVYTEIPSDRLITVFVYLDDCLKSNGALEFLVGSHKNGLLPGSPDEPHHISTENLNFETYCAEGAAGTVVFFDAYTAHQSGPNHSHIPRRTCILTYNPRSIGQFYPNKELRDRLAGLIPNQ